MSPFSFYVAGPLAAILAIASIVIATWLPRKFKAAHMVSILGWILIPPLYFIAEYAWYDPLNFDQFKYGQDLASKLWAAVLAALTTIYTKGALEDFFQKPPTDSTPGRQEKT